MQVVSACARNDINDSSMLAYTFRMENISVSVGNSNFNFSTESLKFTFAVK